MTNNDIVLEYGYCSVISNCNECQRYEQCLSDFANGKCPPKKIRREILDIINRQKAEIENLKDTLYDADGVNLVNYWYQQCEIAENGCRNFKEENENLKAEIERLRYNLKAALKDGGIT